MTNSTGRSVIVSGGAGGVGLAITQRFANNGDHVFVIEREATRQHIEALGQTLITFVGADVLDEASVAAAITQVHAMGGLDVLINVVGGYAAGQPIHELDRATWSHMMDLNVMSTFLLSKYAAQHMITQGSGRIVNFSSRAAVDTAANSGAYAVSKAAVIALTEVQSKELLAYDITVNAVLPSIVDTPANRAAMPKADVTRWPKADEIANVIFFLASDDAKLISGASIPVYGRG